MLFGRQRVPSVRGGLPGLEIECAEPVQDVISRHATRPPTSLCCVVSVDRTLGIERTRRCFARRVNRGSDKTKGAAYDVVHESSATPPASTA